MPSREIVGSVTITKQVREIAEAKMKDLNANDIDRRHVDHSGLCPLYGHRGEVRWQNSENVQLPLALHSQAKHNVTVEEAVALVKGNAKAKFDETIEIAQ